MKRIINRIYYIRYELQYYKLKELKYYEKSNYGDIYNSRIELFLGYLTQNIPQEALIVEVNNEPAYDYSPSLNKPLNGE